MGVDPASDTVLSKADERLLASVAEDATFAALVAVVRKIDGRAVLALRQRDKARAEVAELGEVIELNALAFAELRNERDALAERLRVVEAEHSASR